MTNPDDISRRLLDELVKDPNVTQRDLSSSLGIALGLVNAYIKRLCKKGYVKATTLPRNRIKYIITPKGFTEKARLTYSYMQYSIGYFREVRQRIERIYAVMMADGVREILLWGDGEIAELCYISTRGLPIKIIGVVADRTEQDGFFGHRVVTADNINEIDHDAILVTSLEDKPLELTERPGTDHARVYYL
jgi:DNA-binding MarR family transcriptional regulator